VLIELRLPGISGVRTIARLGCSPRLGRTGAHPLRRKPRRRSDRCRRQRLHHKERAAERDHRRRPRARRGRIRALPADRGEASSSGIRDRETPITANSQDAANAIRAALTERELEIFSQLASRYEQQRL